MTNLVGTTLKDAFYQEKITRFIFKDIVRVRCGTHERQITLAACRELGKSMLGDTCEITDTDQGKVSLVVVTPEEEHAAVFEKFCLSQLARNPAQAVCMQRVPADDDTMQAILRCAHDYNMVAYVAAIEEEMERRKTAATRAAQEWRQMRMYWTSIALGVLVTVGVIAFSAITVVAGAWGLCGLLGRLGEKYTHLDLCQACTGHCGTLAPGGFILMDSAILWYIIFVGGVGVSVLGPEPLFQKSERAVLDFFFPKPSLD